VVIWFGCVKVVPVVVRTLTSLALVGDVCSVVVWFGCVKVVPVVVRTLTSLALVGGDGFLVLLTVVLLEAMASWFC